MLPMRQLIVLSVLLGSVISMSAQQTPDKTPGSVIARASILEEKYCRGDADVFTVSLKLRIDVANSSKSTVHLLWPMVPWVGKVASSLGDAESGHFLFDQTMSHYPQSAVRFKPLKIKPGKTLTVQSGYDLVARHDPALAFPKSVSAGTYSLVLVFRPEEEPPNQLQAPEILQSITTDPFVVRVPSQPKLVECEPAAKAP